MLKLRQKSRRSPNNGKLKEKISIKKPLKIQSIEPPLEQLIQLNSKEWMRLNHSGFEKNQALKNNNINSSTRMYLETAVIHTLGHTSKLKEMLISQDLSSSQKEHLMTNSINSMRKSQRLSFTSGESWLMISLKNFFPNTWTSSRLLLIQTIFPSMSTDKTCNMIRHLRQLELSFLKKPLTFLYPLTLNPKRKKSYFLKMMKDKNKRMTENSNQPTRRRLKLLLNSGKTSKRILS